MHSMILSLAGAISLITFCHFIIRRAKHTRLQLPPGPRGSLIFGVKQILPTIEPWKTYARWSEEFNDAVISFRVYNRRVVVLNSASAITELLEERANIYSDRPMSWMYNVICGRGKAIFNISSGDPRHKQYRRILQKGLGMRATRDYLPLIQQESARLAAGLLQNPGELTTHVQRNSAAVIMKVAFGYTITDDDPFIKVAEEASKISGWATQPGRWLVDHHPIIRFIPSWFPGAGWKRQGFEWRARLRYLSEVPHQWLRGQMNSGTHADCFTSRLLAPEGGQTVSVEEEDAIKWAAGALYAGAGDTTVSAIISFIRLMALHPKVQMKAQAEIRAAFGDALGAADKKEDSDPSQISRLPYLQAILKEVLRFAPVGNLALPHRLTEDDVYRGYLIPKGATIIANVWAVLHDPAIYPEPYKFSPERFAPCEEEHHDHTHQPDPTQWAFGFGKRACPGEHFAETTMLFAMVNILSRCTISLPKEAPIPVVEFTTGITSHIKGFPIVVEPIRLDEFPPLVSAPASPPPAEDKPRPARVPCVPRESDPIRNQDPPPQDGWCWL
ncbi:cytochrome P450 [Coprinellus micaceus]|uniref:Cytochrome P450 n=1 Tax=Coprinellus micaceus TaxID=71717 RepID=A0A4Y7TPH0_COPMI|nr:cytochrome P450 [Coprinellus micaceus]